MKEFNKQRSKLVDYLVTVGVLKTPRIIKAFRKVRREEFLLDKHKKSAYVDEPLPILSNQTISQPTTIAIMTEALNPEKGDRILEIGSGSGYQAAILMESIVKGEVHTIEIIREVYEFAKNNLLRAGYNINIYCMDGGEGLPDKAPFDKIIVTCAAPVIPEPLIRQLKDGGVLVIPIGKGMSQEMTVIKKNKGRIIKELLGLFAFVPLTGKFGVKPL